MKAHLNPIEIPLALYVHWPWCVQKCPYCDFNSHTANVNLAEVYAQTLLDDWRRQYDALANGRKISSIFFGGGTPSLAKPTVIAQLIDLVHKTAGFTDDVEITLEANPGTVDAHHFEGYYTAGVNRLSLGVQSFNNDLLHKLGRIHDRAQVLTAIELANKIGFSRLNLDLMTGLPSQSLEQVLSDIDMAISLNPEHLSLYQLTLEPNTPFFARPPADLPDEDLADDLQFAVHERARAAGYEQYEVSAWAKGGMARSRHNLNYWQFGDYLGIGAGAHGKITSLSGKILRTHTHKSPQVYIQDLQKDHNLSYLTQQVIARDDLPFEFLLNALRLKEGVGYRCFTKRTGLPLENLTEIWQSLVEEGLLASLENNQLMTTELGYRHLNMVLSRWL